MSALLSSLISLLYPDRCIGCGRVLRHGEWICRPCSEELLPNSGAAVKNGVACVSPYYYCGSAKRAVLRLKRTRSKTIVRFFAESIASEWTKNYSFLPELVVCVPMVAERRRRRGFNQSEALARGVAACLEVPFEPGAMKQIRKIQIQHYLTVPERKNNVRGAYAANREQVQAKTVLLVDDIITTGATMAECLRALQTAGAAKVFAAAATTTPQYKKPGG